MYKEHGFLPDGREWIFPIGGEYTILSESEHSKPEPFDWSMLDVLFEDE